MASRRVLHAKFPRASLRRNRTHRNVKAHGGGAFPIEPRERRIGGEPRILRERSSYFPREVSARSRFMLATFRSNDVSVATYFRKIDGIARKVFLSRSARYRPACKIDRTIVGRARGSRRIASVVSAWQILLLGNFEFRISIGILRLITPDASLIASKREMRVRKNLIEIIRKIYVTELFTEARIAPS